MEDSNNNKKKVAPPLKFSSVTKSDSFSSVQLTPLKARLSTPRVLGSAPHLSKYQEKRFLSSQSTTKPEDSESVLARAKSRIAAVRDSNTEWSSLRSSTGGSSWLHRPRSQPSLQLLNFESSPRSSPSQAKLLWSEERKTASNLLLHRIPKDDEAKPSNLQKGQGQNDILHKSGISASSPLIKTDDYINSVPNSIRGNYLNGSRSNINQDSTTGKDELSTSSENSVSSPVIKTNDVQSDVPEDTDVSRDTQDSSAPPSCRSDSSESKHELSDEPLTFTVDTSNNDDYLEDKSLTKPPKSDITGIVSNGPITNTKQPDERELPADSFDVKNVGIPSENNKSDDITINNDKAKVAAETVIQSNTGDESNDTNSKSSELDSSLLSSIQLDIGLDLKPSGLSNCSEDVSNFEKSRFPLIKRQSETNNKALNISLERSDSDVVKTSPVTRNSSSSSSSSTSSALALALSQPTPSPRRKPRVSRHFSQKPIILDDDEFIGFATLPDQVHRKAVKRGFEFSLMVVGETGLGKSTLINSLFLTDLYKDRKNPNVEEVVQRTVGIEKKQLEIEERGVKLRLTIVDTPGFNDAVNGEESWKPIIDYVDKQFEQYYQAESGLNRKNIQDARVHCCLYFISPYGHGLKPIDVMVMRKLHHKVNIVPLLAKSDILTPKEVKKLKAKILEEIAENKIQIYNFPDCDSDEDEDFKQQDKALKAAIPFAVVGSNTVVEAGGKKIRGRMYPWGIVEVDNPKHCDFGKLRQMLISTHMQDLKDITSDVHYENYRADHLAAEMNRSQRERSKLKRDSAANLDAVMDTDKLLQQKEAEIQRMQAMLAKMQAQLQSSPNAKMNGSVGKT